MATSKVRHKKGGTVIKGGTEGVEESHFFMGSGGGRMNLNRITGKQTDAWKEEEKKKKEAVKKSKPVEGGRSSIAQRAAGKLKRRLKTGLMKV
jgi:hypothetical protein